MHKEPCVYILTNRNHTVLYTGVTSDLARRLEEHRTGQGSAFTKRYRATKLVYVAYFTRMMDAIEHEKWLKAGSRQRKIDLINETNPSWSDLSEELY